MAAGPNASGSRSYVKYIFKQSGTPLRDETAETLRQHAVAYSRENRLLLDAAKTRGGTVDRREVLLRYRSLIHGSVPSGGETALKQMLTLQIKPKLRVFTKP
ncbi:MAG: hypothetical protein M3541_13470 [Acidobacteriota bacterium]|nr:hypothetical protein [Acidobacteriota bacterium]